MPTKKPTGLTIGMDLGDRRHTVCVLNAKGDILAEDVIANTREVLAAYSQRFAAATIVMETGTHSSSRCPHGGHPLTSPSLRFGLRHLRAGALRRRG